jgi:hypothetical protein
MAYRVRKVNYFNLTVPNSTGQAEQILRELRTADINLHAFSGFPVKARRTQIDLVTDDSAKLRKIAKKNGWRISKTKKAFLVTGNDEVGAVHKVLKKLADNKINITAADAASAGKGRYGMILWVKPKVYSRAARILRAI